MANLDFKEIGNILVVAEIIGGRIQPVSLELLKKARQLGDSLGARVNLALVGYGLEGLLEDLLDYDLDRIFQLDHPLLKDFDPQVYSRLLAGLVESREQDLILMPSTSLSRDLSPRLAARLGAGLIADCIDIGLEDGELIYTRPSYGGRALASLGINTRYKIATMRPGLMARLEKTPGRRAEVEKFEPSIDLDSVGTRILEKFPPREERANLKEARIVVAGGKGLARKEGFELLEDLARVLGGELASSRVAVDAGWIDRDYQVGQTGLTVRPDIYIACGISGAIQHQAGMNEAKYIVAINKDPEAAIFSLADYAIVGDLYEIIPSLIESLKAKGL